MAANIKNDNDIKHNVIKQGGVLEKELGNIPVSYKNDNLISVSEANEDNIALDKDWIMEESSECVNYNMLMTENLGTYNIEIKLENFATQGKCANYNITQCSSNNPNSVQQENNNPQAQVKIQVDNSMPRDVQLKRESTDLGIDYIGIDENSELVFQNDHETSRECSTTIVNLQSTETSTNIIETQDISNQPSVSYIEYNLTQDPLLGNKHTEQQSNDITDANNEQTLKKKATIFQCNECNKVFKWRSTLKAHMKIHTGEKPFACTHCDFRFLRRSVLKLHLKRHEGLKPFQCNFCDATFVTKGELEEHFNSKHSVNKPYKCETCDKSFATNKSLGRHVNIHRDEKPYQCEFCSIRYNNEYNMRRHMKVHDKALFDTCTNCGRICGNSGAMMRHARVCLRRNYNS